ncbi:hypothetical protein F5888DRAFT_1386402 [Russula emetica]|nr:hypothetical protein F5888DRAFT_1386402 [Russula emetica]
MATVSYRTLSAPDAFKLHPVTDRDYGSHDRGYIRLRSVRFCRRPKGRVCGTCSGRRISRNLLIDLHTRRFRKTDGEHYELLNIACVLCFLLLTVDGANVDEVEKGCRASSCYKHVIVILAMCRLIGGTVCTVVVTWNCRGMCTNNIR